MDNGTFKCLNCGGEIFNDANSADVFNCPHCGFEFQNPAENAERDIPVMQLQTSPGDSSDNPFHAVGNSRRMVSAPPVRNDSDKAHRLSGKIIFCTALTFVICAAAIVCSLFFFRDELRFSKDLDTAVQNYFSYFIKERQKDTNLFGYALRDRQKDISLKIVQEWEYEDYVFCGCEIRRKGISKKSMELLLMQQNDDGYWVVISERNKIKSEDGKFKNFVNNTRNAFRKMNKDAVSLEELLEAE